MNESCAEIAAPDRVRQRIIDVLQHLDTKGLIRETDRSLGPREL
jgi:hypothetical protein